MDNNTQLPAEVLEEIKLKSEDIANHLINGRIHPEAWEGVFKSFETCAIEYATMLYQAEQEIAQLKRWKMEAAELLAQIHAYVHKNIEKSLGQCNVKLVLERCKQYELATQMLFRLASLVNADVKPDEKFLTEIKIFLDRK